MQVKKAFSLNSKFEPQNVSLKKEKLKWSQLNEFLLCSSKRIIPLLALVFYQTSKEQNEKLNLMTNCLDNFILYKNLCRDIEPSNWIVPVFLRKILTACSCLKQNLWEQNETSTIEKLLGNQKKNIVWEFIADIESSNTIVTVYLKKTLQLAHVFDLTVNSNRFNWSRLNSKQFELKSFDFVFVNFNTKFSENANFLLTRLSFISPVSQTEVGSRKSLFFCQRQHEKI